MATDTRDRGGEVIVSVFSERDVLIIRYRFGSLRSALDFLSNYVPPNDCYTELS